MECEERWAVFVEEAAKRIGKLGVDFDAVVVDQDWLEIAARAGFDGDLVGGDRGAAEDAAGGPGVVGEDHESQLGANDALVAFDVEVEVVLLADLRERAEE